MQNSDPPARITCLWPLEPVVVFERLTRFKSHLNPPGGAWERALGVATKMNNLPMNLAVGQLTIVAAHVEDFLIRYRDWDVLKMDFCGQAADSRGHDHVLPVNVRLRGQDSIQIGTSFH